MLGLDRQAARWTWTAVFILLLLDLVYRIRETLFIFIVALLFAYLLWPLVRYLDLRLPGKSKVLALTLVYLALVSFLIVVGTAIGSRVVIEAHALAVRLPDLLNKVQPPPAPAALPETQGAEDTIVTAVRNEVANHSRQFLALLPSAALDVISRARSLIFVVLIPVLSFFFLKDGAEMRDSLLGLISFSSYRETAERIAADLHVLLAQYIRALVLLGTVAAFAYGAFLSILGVQYAILLAVVVFPLEFIPLVGPLTGASIVLLVAGLTGSAHHLLAILTFLVVFRLFQDYVVSPHLLSSGMKLHPLMVIFGVLAGGSIAGVAGSFLSVPVLATLRIIYRQLPTQPSAIVAPNGVVPPSA